VVISVKDLAALLGAAKEPTFGEVLDAVGFRPYSGRHVIVSERRSRERLKRGSAAASKMI